MIKKGLVFCLLLFFISEKSLAQHDEYKISKDSLKSLFKIVELSKDPQLVFETYKPIIHYYSERKSYNNCWHLLWGQFGSGQALRKPEFYQYIYFELLKAGIYQVNNLAGLSKIIKYLESDTSKHNFNLTLFYKYKLFIRQNDLRKLKVNIDSIKQDYYNYLSYSNVNSVKFKHLKNDSTPFNHISFLVRNTKQGVIKSELVPNQLTYPATTDYLAFLAYNKDFDSIDKNIVDFIAMSKNRNQLMAYQLFQIYSEIAKGNRSKSKMLLDKLTKSKEVKPPLFKYQIKILLVWWADKFVGNVSPVLLKEKEKAFESFILNPILIDEKEKKKIQNLDYARVQLIKEIGEEIEEEKKQTYILIGKQESRLKTNRYITFFSLFTLSLGGVFFYFYRKKNEILLNTFKELQTERKRSVDSINAAKSIQQTILGKQYIIQRNFQNFDVFYHPVDEVSGDFYWAYEKEGLLFFSLIDCTGHGVPGAFVSMVANAVLLREVELTDYDSFDSLMERISNSFDKQFGSTKEKHYAGMDMGIICARLSESTHEVDDNTPTLELKYSGAKIPLFFNRNKTDEFVKIKATSRGIGGLQNRGKMFETHHITMQKGDKLVMSSDGYKDQNNEVGQYLKSKKFHEILVANNDPSLKEFKKKMETSFFNFKGNSRQNDDVLVTFLEC